MKKLLFITVIITAGCGGGGETKITSCPQNAEYWLVAGQSNAANMAQYSDTGKIYTYSNGECNLTNSPLQNATGSGYNPFELVAKQYTIKTGKPVILVVYAVGGTKIEVFKNTYLSSIESLAKSLPRVDRFIWQQGESDAKFNTDPEQYKQDFKTIVSSVNATSTHIARSSVCGEVGYYNPIGITQTILQQTYAGPDTDTIWPRYDGCHLRDAEVEKFSQLWVSFLTR